MRFSLFDVVVVEEDSLIEAPLIGPFARIQVSRQGIRIPSLAIAYGHGRRKRGDKTWGDAEVERWKGEKVGTLGGDALKLSCHMDGSGRLEDGSW